MELKTIIYEKKGKIAYITMNRPEKLNALNIDLRSDLLRCWEDFAGDDNAWVAILNGAGKAFSVGADFGDMSPDPAKESLGGLQTGEIDVFKPIIATIHGYALGVGASLALACDIRICAEDLHFGYSNPRHGVQSIGGPTRLPRWTFPGEAMYYLLTTEHMDAAEAYRLGLVHKVVPTPEDLVPEATKIAHKIMENSPMAIRTTKEAYTRGFGVQFMQALHISKSADRRNKKTEDYQEGIAAFSEKRKPVWKGK
ncbi:enoyl-CoA hydratase-related protein [Chloroflexota bacterium]